MHFHLNKQATGRGNAASCGRMGGEGGGHTPGCFSPVCHLYNCCLWSDWFITKPSSVDTTVLWWSLRLTPDPHVENIQNQQNLNITNVYFFEIIDK